MGIFDAIAPAASAALQALDAGDTDRYEKILAPTVPLSRHIFQAPTRYHKTGVVFLAYINGHQDHFRMVGSQEGARSVTHLSELFVLTDRAGLLHDPDLYPQISRASGRIFGFHANDWLSPKPDLLLSRAMMGDGPIEIRRIRAAVDAAGYAGPIEVEIFNQDVWNAPGDEVLALTKERYLLHA